MGTPKKSHSGMTWLMREGEREGITIKHSKAHTPEADTRATRFLTMDQKFEARNPQRAADHRKARHLPSEAPEQLSQLFMGPGRRGPELCPRLPAVAVLLRASEKIKVASSQPGAGGPMGGRPEPACLPVPGRGQGGLFARKVLPGCSPLGSAVVKVPRPTPSKRGRAVSVQRSQATFSTLRGGRRGQEAGVAPQGRRCHSCPPQKLIPRLGQGSATGGPKALAPGPSSARPPAGKAQRTSPDGRGPSRRRV